MKRATAAAFVLCLVICFLLAAGCSSSPANGKDSAQTASAGTTETVSPAASSDVAKPLRATPADLPKIDVPAGSVAKYYVYTLNGTEGVIGLASFCAIRTAALVPVSYPVFFTVNVT